MNRLIDAENSLLVSEGRGVGGVGKNGEWIKNYKLIVIEWPQRDRLQHREYSQ